MAATTPVSVARNFFCFRQEDAVNSAESEKAKYLAVAFSNLRVPGLGSVSDREILYDRINGGAFYHVWVENHKESIPMP